MFSQCKSLRSVKLPDFPGCDEAPDMFDGCVSLREINTPYGLPDGACKYLFTDETMEYQGHTLHRIRAVRDVGDSVKSGDLGGWIESFANLDHCRDCWVGGDAKVWGKALIIDYAQVSGNVKLSGHIHVSKNAIVHKQSTHRWQTG